MSNFQIEQASAKTDASERRGNTSQIDIGPVVDSPNNEAFEAIAELYFQSKGYITSSGKWFWTWGEGKRQRGYQDIDVLAIDHSTTVIVSVVTNLDDKVSATDLKRENHDGHSPKVSKLYAYFNNVEGYLKAVPEYRWLVDGNRKVRRVVACVNEHGKESALNSVRTALLGRGIEVLAAKAMMAEVVELARRKNMKIQNQMLRTIRIFDQMGLINSGGQ